MTLTTAQILREVSSLNVLMGSRLDSSEGPTAERFAAISTQFGLLDQQQDTKLLWMRRYPRRTKRSRTADHGQSADDSQVGDGHRQADQPAERELRQRHPGAVNTLNDSKERVGEIEFVKAGSSEEAAHRHLEKQAQGEMVPWSAAATGAFATIGSVLLAVWTATHR